MSDLISQGATFNELEQAAIAIHEADKAMNESMAKLGAAYLNEHDVLYTHCNTGALATGGTGTALGVIKHALANKRVSMSMPEKHDLDAGDSSQCGSYNKRVFLQH